jgi:DNA-directed RNA polymerase subunit F
MPLLGRGIRLIELPEPALDHVQRRAQLVGEYREELVLEAIRLLRGLARRSLARAADLLP